MGGKIALLGLVWGLGVTAARAQMTTPNPGDMYCSGMFTTEAIPRDTFIITGEESNYKTTFSEEDYVYINKGSSQGVKVGDEFLVMRPVSYTGAIKWYSWQTSLRNAMGTAWEDEGRLKVVVAQANVSIAQVAHSCNYMQRGDIVLPFAERPAPTLKSEERFDRFAPPSGNKTAMVVIGKRFQLQMGTNDIAYLNLGSAQGVNVGDYFRIFRYQNGTSETVYKTWRQSFQVYGFGSVPLRYNWSNVPREVLGEGIVLRATPNSSTVLITFSLREIFVGDYAELE